MCCFYPGNVICLNAPPTSPPLTRGPGRQLCSFLSGCCHGESRLPVGNYFCRKLSYAALPNPPPGPKPGSCRFIGCPRRPPKLPRWDSLRRRVVRVNTVSGREQTQRRWRPSGRAEEGESEVWQPLCGPSLRKCSHRKYLRVVMCKHGRCW